jgi:hypothetical protein
MNKGGVDADALGDVSQRYAVEPILGKQVLGGIEDLFNALCPLFRLAAARTLVLGRLSHVAATH